jgi:hypothetical protein
MTLGVKHPEVFYRKAKKVLMQGCGIHSSQWTHRCRSLSWSGAGWLCFAGRCQSVDKVQNLLHTNPDACLLQASSSPGAGLPVKKLQDFFSGSGGFLLATERNCLVICRNRKDHCLLLEALM